MAQVWRTRGETSAVVELPLLRSRLLSLRGVNEAGEESFFRPTYETSIHDPLLLHGMEEAVERIFSAVKKKQHIVVYGDYDADGISSTAVLITALREIGAVCSPYLPHRSDEGYGLNLGALKMLAAEADLIITVDCGVANVEEIEWLAQEKVDVIVVDHHEMGKELPKARAVLHPRHPEGKYPWGYLCGAGVTWKLCQQLWRHYHKMHGKTDPDAEKWLLDLALLGTVADIVPLVNENRAIVHFGLVVLARTRRPGLRALLDSLRLDSSTLSAKDVSHRIVPRLNAPGRLDHPQPALDLLLASSGSEASRLAAVLEQYNTRRQTVSRKVAREAEAQVVAEAPFVFAFNPGWPAGVVGLAASQLAQKFSRPAVIIGGNGKHGVGSARSPKGSNILRILEAGREHVLKLGGHAQAAGFSVLHDKINDFHAALMEYAKAGALGRHEQQPLHIDAVIDQQLLTWQTAEMLMGFEPFGEGNSSPVLAVKKVPVSSVRRVGKTGDHLKLGLDVAGPLDVIGFGLGERAEKLGTTIDMAGTLKMDFYGGRARLAFELLDVAPAGKVKIVSAVEQTATA